MLVSELTKLNVYDSKAKLVGRVQDLVVDPKNLTLSAVVLELEDSASKALFGSKPLLGKSTVHGSIDLIERVGDAIILKNSVEELKGKFTKL